MGVGHDPLRLAPKLADALTGKKFQGDFPGQRLLSRLSRLLRQAEEHNVGILIPPPSGKKMKIII